MISSYTLANLFHHSFIQIEKLLHFKQLLSKWGIKHNEEWLLYESASSSKSMVVTHQLAVHISVRNCFKMQHRRLCWSHHCRDDGTASIAHRDLPLYLGLQLVLREPVQIYKMPMQNHCMGTRALAVQLVAFQIWELFWVEEAAIQCQNTTRRWRRCCPTHHLMQQSWLLSPSWHTMH